MQEIMGIDLDKNIGFLREKLLKTIYWLHRESKQAGHGAEMGRGWQIRSVLAGDILGQIETALFGQSFCNPTWWKDRDTKERVMTRVVEDDEGALFDAEKGCIVCLDKNYPSDSCTRRYPEVPTVCFPVPNRSYTYQQITFMLLSKEDDSPQRLSHDILSRLVHFSYDCGPTWKTTMAKYLTEFFETEVKEGKSL